MKKCPNCNGWLFKNRLTGFVDCKKCGFKNGDVDYRTRYSSGYCTFLGLFMRTHKRRGNGFMKQVYFKVLVKGRKSCHGGKAVWKIGKWMPKIKDIIVCEKGYHLCRLQDLLQWVDKKDGEVWFAEGKGNKIVSDNKVVFQQARITKKTAWNERTARLFAADCAEHVLKIWTKKYPDDKRPAEAIQAARDFANGKIDKKQLAAARSAARSAAWSAVWSAAESTAVSTARSAARSAEYKWQTKRLIKYLDGELP